MCVCHNELSKSRVETQHVIKLRQQHETKLQISREVRDFEDFVRVENSWDYRLLQKNSRVVVVGATGFEPATARPPGVCATGLRYAPIVYLWWRVIQLSVKSFHIHTMSAVYAFAGINSSNYIGAGTDCNQNSFVIV